MVLRSWSARSCWRWASPPAPADTRGDVPVNAELSAGAVPHPRTLRQAEGVSVCLHGAACFLSPADPLRPGPGAAQNHGRRLRVAAEEGEKNLPHSPSARARLSVDVVRRCRVWQGCGEDEDAGEGTSLQQEVRRTAGAGRYIDVDVLEDRALFLSSQCTRRADLLASIKSKAYGQAAVVCVLSHRLISFLKVLLPLTAGKEPVHLSAFQGTAPPSGGAERRQR